MKTTNWDQLQNALSGLKKSNPEGFTCREFSDQMGCTLDRARIHIGDLIRVGKLKFAGHRTITRIDGRLSQAPVFAEAKPEKPQRKRA